MNVYEKIAQPHFDILTKTEHRAKSKLIYI